MTCPPARRAARLPAGRSAARAWWRGAGLRTITAGCLVLAGAICLASGWGTVPLWAGPVAAAAVAGGQLLAGSGVGRQRGPACLTEAAVGACLVLSAGAWSVLAVGVGVALAQPAGRAPRAHRELDIARGVLAAALGQALCGVVGGGVVGACAGTAVYWLVSSALLALAVARTSARPLASLLASRVRHSALPASASGSVGLLAGHLALDAPWGLLALAVPAVVVVTAYDRVGRSDEARLFAELARGPGRTPDASAGLLVTAAARLLGGADVELLVLTADGPVCFTGDENGSPARRPAELDEPWVLRALGSAGVLRGRDEGRPYVTTVLGGDDQPLGVLRARRGADAPGFDRRDLQLADVLGQQARAWLDEPVAGRQPDGGPVGEGVGTAMSSVRTTAERLAGLASRSVEPGGGVDEVVSELHALERAVAALVGASALALHAVPSQRTAGPAMGTGRGTGPGGPHASSVVAGGGADRVDREDNDRIGREDVGWTTTGVLR